MEEQSGDHFPHPKQARLIACHGMAAEAAQPGCFLAQMCCMTFSLGCGGSAPLAGPECFFCADLSEAAL